MALSGCVSIDDEIKIGLQKTENRRVISVNEPSDVEFNAHSFIWQNGMNRYKITIPKQGLDVEGNSISLSTYFIGAGTPTKIKLDKSSSVKFRKCDVHITLFDDKKIPLSFNGIYVIPSWLCDKVT